jgi:hypothetical protein
MLKKYGILDFKFGFSPCCKCSTVVQYRSMECFCFQKSHTCAHARAHKITTTTPKQIALYFSDLSFYPGNKR